MSRRGENIYKRKDGRYEGRYVLGRTARGHTKLGYVYGRQFHTVRSILLKKKAALQQESKESGGSRLRVSEWMERWLEQDRRGQVRESSYPKWQGWKTGASSQYRPFTQCVRARFWV